SYDDYGELPLTDYSLPQRHDSTFGTAATVRGNLTKNIHWLDDNTAYTSKRKYDILGNVVQEIDAHGNSTYFTFGSSCSYGFATNVKNALTHEVNIDYDCDTGKVTDFTDQNQVKTHYSYEPSSLGRLVQVDRAYQRAEQATTTFNYVDTPNSVSV